MRLIKLRIENYGKLNNADYTFSEDITQFCEDNGFGKTTLASFIKAMFYGLPSVKEKGKDFNDRKRFYPFGGGKFGGNLVFEMNGSEYRIERFFDKKSETKDECKVFCNNTPFSDFGTDIGKAVFGLDKDSFERTVFITSEAVDVLATSSINAKLNNFVDDTDGGAGFDDAVEALEKAKKRLKAARGNNDLISDRQAEILKINNDIENIRKIQAELESLYSQSAKLKEEIRQAEKIREEAVASNTVLERWNVYENTLARKSADGQALKELEENFPKGIPTDAQLAEMKSACREIIALNGQKRVAGFNEQKRGRLEVLSQTFAGGAPDESTLRVIQDKIDGVRELELKITASPSHARKPKGLNEKILIAALIAVLVIAVGVGLLFVNSIAGGIIVGLGGAGLVYCVAVILTGLRESNRSPNAEEGRPNEMQNALSSQKAELTEFFGKFGLAGVDLQRNIISLRTEAAEYRLLTDETERAEESVAAVEKTIRDLQDGVNCTLSGYGITPSDDIASQLEVLEKHSFEIRRLHAVIASAEREAEDYKRKYELTVKPDAEMTDTSEIARTISEKRREEAVLDGQIADAESWAEQLGDKENRLAEAKEELDAFKRRYKILSAALETLKTAESNLKEKYVAPVRDRFLHYAALLESAPGEEVSLDKNFAVAFERGGEIRSDRHLSAGQRSICALCMRIALIDSMFENEKPFIVMDDPFVNLDAAHMEKTVKTVKAIARDKQIIYFCCHESRSI